MINTIRGLVRPVLTAVGFGMFSLLTFKYPDTLIGPYTSAVMVMVGYWFGSRTGGHNGPTNPT